jgi:hypothetical protein
MKEQMKAMLAADEQRIRADERARCAAIVRAAKHNWRDPHHDAPAGWDEADDLLEAAALDILSGPGPDPIAEARADAFEEAARIAEAEAEMHDPQEPYYALPIHKACIDIAAAIRAAGRQG